MDINNHDNEVAMPESKSITPKAISGKSRIVWFVIIGILCLICQLIGLYSLMDHMKEKIKLSAIREEQQYVENTITNLRSKLSEMNQQTGETKSQLLTIEGRLIKKKDEIAILNKQRDLAIAEQRDAMLTSKKNRIENEQHKLENQGLEKAISNLKNEIVELQQQKQLNEQYAKNAKENYTFKKQAVDLLDSSYKEKLKVWQQELEILNSNIQSIDDIGEVLAKLNKAKNDYAIISSNLQEAEKQYNYFQDKITEKQINYTSLNSEKSQLNKDVVSLRNTFEKQSKELEKLKSQALSLKINHSKTKFSRDALQEQYDKLKLLVDSFESQKKSIQKDVYSKEIEFSNLEGAVETKKLEITKKTVIIAYKKEELTSLDEKYSKITTKISDSEAQLKKLKEQIEAAKTEIEDSSKDK